jgi:hypothetical protein
MQATDYSTFLARKSQLGTAAGFEPLWLPDFLFGFQRHLVEWAVRKGRAAIFADCGLGKTACELVWAENVVRKTNRPVIECSRNITGSTEAKIVVTNYEQLHRFSPDDFVGMVCDESSILKNFAGKRRHEITEFMRRMPYRLLCTATAAPNDYVELGTSSDALGCLGYRDMLTTFFKEETKKDYLGWGRKTYRFRGHAEEPFWRWVCSWARACRKPSDLGFDDGRFVLPPLVEREMLIENSTPRPGMLFAVPAFGLDEQREERRVTVRERCEAAAKIAADHDGSSVLWCQLNDEGDLLEKLTPDSLQVSGSMADEKKEERMLAFQRGELKRLVIKPKIGCFGLNWQHCHNVVTMTSNSFEQYYQAVRRCWRFGQTKPVAVTVISTAGEQRVLDNLQRKAVQAGRMFESLVANMSDAAGVDRGFKFSKKQEVPKWLS